MNWLLITAAVLSWLAIGAVISGVTDAYLHERRGSLAGFAMATVFWPIALAIGCACFLGIGLWALNKIAYTQAARVRAMRDGVPLRADEPPMPRDRERYGELIDR